MYPPRQPQPSPYPPPPAPLPPLAAPTVGPGYAALPAHGSRPRIAVVVPLAVLCVGLMAGIFWGFALSVMPGLARVGDVTFVATMQQMNAAIENVVFGAIFLGGVVFPAVAVATEAIARRRAGALLAGLGLVLYVATVGITMAVNIPLNETLATAHEAHGQSAAAARAAFEQPWVAAHLVRTLTCTAAMACLILVPHVGRRAPNPAVRSPRAW